MCFFFFFFKQKTAYEMRISDWSSDVCSSDLLDYKGRAFLVEHRKFGIGVFGRGTDEDERDAAEIVKLIRKAVKTAAPCFEWLASEAVKTSNKIGRASCRERVCQYV